MANQLYFNKKIKKQNETNINMPTYLMSFKGQNYKW